MSQLTLDGGDTRVRTLEIEKRRWLKPCWAAKCAQCGAWLTKWDFTEQDAHDIAVAELDQGKHLCAPSAGDTTNT